MRSVNIIFAMILFIVFIRIFTKNAVVAEQQPILPALVRSLELMHLPVLWFFIFLYYTDMGSAVFTVLCYYFAHELQRFHLAALVW